MTKLLKKFKQAAYLFVTVLLCALFIFLSACSSDSGGSDDTDAEESPIVSVTALGFIDYDGPKLQGIAVEYGRDLTGADVTKDTYTINVYSSIVTTYIGNGKIGDITDVYVNDEAAVADSPSGSGKYVIIEVFTDYYSSSELSYSKTMSATVTQVKDITLSNGTVIESSTTSVNNTISNKAKTYNFIIPEIEGFKYYTNIESDYGADGEAFYAEDCFSQQDGLYYDVELSYALYLPEDYHSDGNYAMITLQNPAASSTTHPMTSVLAYRSASVYASDEMQQLVKDEHGVDGLIVLVPVVTERVNDNGGTPAEYEAIVRLWDYVIEKYNVNTDYIYGSGQSVGGMILLETNRNRDNFFAGILLYDNQWGQNYYIDGIFSRGMASAESVANSATMHYPRVNFDMTWDYYLDTDGNQVTEDHDPYNYYYLVSDDNIMILNEEGGGMSNDTWTEMKYLYYDLTGYDLQHKIIDGTQSLSAQCEELTEWTQREDSLNINWISFSGTETSRMVDSSYEWLLSQSRQTEISREKLDLNKPFAIAVEQIQTEERKLSFHTASGEDMYYLTGKYGAGTQGYNSCLLNTTSVADAEPGWLPDGMSWEEGVSIGHIEEVTVISDTAVAIKYDCDMSGIVINLKGENVYNWVSGEYRDDDYIVIDPYAFYDEDGNYIELTISNLYVNSSAATIEGAELKSGSGCYVIVEFTGSGVSSAATMLQLTTVRTNKVFCNASFRYTNISSS